MTKTIAIPGAGVDLAKFNELISNGGHDKTGDTLGRRDGHRL